MEQRRVNVGYDSCPKEAELPLQHRMLGALVPWNKNSVCARAAFFSPRVAMGSFSAAFWTGSEMRLSPEMRVVPLHGPPTRPPQQQQQQQQQQQPGPPPPGSGGGGRSGSQQHVLTSPLLCGQTGAVASPPTLPTRGAPFPWSLLLHERLDVAILDLSPSFAARSLVGAYFSACSPHPRFFSLRPMSVHSQPDAGPRTALTDALSKSDYRQDPRTSGPNQISATANEPWLCS
ncbi:unnamed protein product [Pleuronectes platessa]|uniref:Uncharacterized protein n=1 Tax=Pleuronectes platessa TaxID=8262 RepID=A0A9N7ZED2_PLEPL|nr:unnamed protein product [Pleuronectes platessa]